MQEVDSSVVSIQRIFLTGLPGSGKTTIGQRAADLLRWSFVDTDDVLAARMGMPVGQVLLEYGEERFRHLESQVLHDLAGNVHVVISTGGGTVISEANRKFMRENGLMVYLQVGVDTSWKRMQEASVHIVRPLVAGANGRQRLQDLYMTRRKWYEEAHMHIDTEEGTQDELVQRLIAAVMAVGSGEDGA